MCCLQTVSNLWPNHSLLLHSLVLETLCAEWRNSAMCSSLDHACQVSSDDALLWLVVQMLFASLRTVSLSIIFTAFALLLHKPLLTRWSSNTVTTNGLRYQWIARSTTIRSAWPQDAVAMLLKLSEDLYQVPLHLLLRQQKALHMLERQTHSRAPLLLPIRCFVLVFGLAIRTAMRTRSLLHRGSHRASVVGSSAGWAILESSTQTAWALWGTWC